MVDEKKLRVELALRRMPQWRLAKLLFLPPSTLSDYIRGARPEPLDLAPRIERVLTLPAGALQSQKSRLRREGQR
jgi:predicted transcriptional regulator